MLTTLPAITGFTATYANIGKTSNKGVEFSVNAAIVQTKDFNINVGANINFNKNKVDELAPGVNGIYGTGWFSANNPSNDMILMEGEPVGLVRGLTYVGMYTTDDFTYDPATKVHAEIRCTRCQSTDYGCDARFGNQRPLWPERPSWYGKIRGS